MIKLIALISALSMPITIMGTESNLTPKEAEQLNTLNKWYNEFNAITRGFDPKVVHEFIDSKGIPLAKVNHENNLFEMKHYEQQKMVKQLPSTEDPSPIEIAVADPVPSSNPFGEQLSVAEQLQKHQQQQQQEVDGQQQVANDGQKPSSQPSTQSSDSFLSPEEEEEQEEERIKRRQSALRLLKNMIHLPHLLLGHALRDSKVSGQEVEEEPKEKPQFELSDSESFSRGWPQQEKDEKAPVVQDGDKSHVMPFAMIISITSHHTHDNGDGTNDGNKDEKEGTKEEAKEAEETFFPSSASSQKTEESENNPFGPFMSAILSSAVKAFDDSDDGDCGCEDIGMDNDGHDQQEQKQQPADEPKAVEEKVEEPKERPFEEWIQREVEEVPRKPVEGPRPSPFMMSMRMRHHQPPPPFFHPFFTPRVPQKSWSLDPSDKFYTGKLPREEPRQQVHHPFGLFGRSHRMLPQIWL